MDWETELECSVAEGDEVKAEELARAALDSGAPAREVLEKGAVAGIYEAGRLWQEGEYFLPDVILATEAYNVVMGMVKPLLAGGAGSAKGKVVMGSVEGTRTTWARTSSSLCCAAPLYEVVDLGVDVPAERFVEAVRDGQPGIIGLGAYMTTTMRNMEAVVSALEEAGLRDKVKVIVGGAAVTADYANKIGADGYGADAVEAVRLADGLLGVG